MAMDKDVLGGELKAVRDKYSNKTSDQLISEYGSIDAARLQSCKDEAEAIINHIKNYAKPQVPGTGLGVSGSTVTGLSTTGSII